MSRSGSGTALRTGDALRVQFVLFLVISSVGSSVLSFRGYQLLPVFWASGGMLVYLMAARARAPDEVGKDDFADSFYYMGFLLTLVALVVVLVRFGDQSQEDLLRAVLSQFGLALVTTFIGLTGRVTIVMFRSDVDESGTSSRVRLERAQTELYNTLNRLQTETEAVTKRFAGALEATLGPVEDGGRRIAASAEVIADRFSQIESRLQTFSDVIATSSSGVGNAWAEAIEGVQAANKKMEAVSALPEAVREKLSRTVEAAAGLEKSVVTLESDLDRLSRGVERLRGAIDGGRDSMEAGLQAWGRTCDHLATAQSDLAKKANEMNRSLAGVRDELAESVEFLTKRLGADEDTVHG